MLSSETTSPRPSPSMLGVLRKILLARMDPDQLNPVDPELVELALPLIGLLERYFRARVTGLDNIPHGPALIVGNHNAGITFLEPFLFGVAWWRHNGGNLQVHALAHDAIVALPALGNLVMLLGTVRASHETAHKALRAGHKVAVWPGGNHEAWRPWTQRHLVDFGGHKGFVRLAIRNHVPIVPLLSVGGHDYFFVLTRGEALSRLLGLDRLLRSKACPVFVAPPWGLALGPVFHLPLPAQCEVEVGKAISLEHTNPHQAEDHDVVDTLYRQVTGQLQAMMDRHVAARRARRRQRLASLLGGASRWRLPRRVFPG